MKYVKRKQKKREEDEVRIDSKIELTHTHTRARALSHSLGLTQFKQDVLKKKVILDYWHQMTTLSLADYNEKLQNQITKDSRFG